MLKISVIALILFIGLFRVRKSVRWYKISYFLLVIYEVTIAVNSIHQKILFYLNAPELVEIYETYIFAILLVCNIGGIFKKHDAHKVSAYRPPQEDKTPPTNASPQVNIPPESEREPIPPVQIPKSYNIPKDNFTIEAIKDERAELVLDAPEFINKFQSKERLLDSPLEFIIYDALKKFINEAYIILPHVAIRDIAKWTWRDNWFFTDRVNGMHFDFVIFDSLFYPILFIEINGTAHDDPKVQERDRFKRALAEKLGIKLASIDFFESLTDNEIEMRIRNGIINAIPSRMDYAVHAKSSKCGYVKYEIRKNRTSGEFFYGCSEYHKCDPEKRKKCIMSRSIEDIPPLYYGISVENKCSE